MFHSAIRKVFEFFLFDRTLFRCCLSYKKGGQQMKLNKRLFGPWVCAAGFCSSGSRHHKHRANSRRVKDMVSQPNKRLGQAYRDSVYVYVWWETKQSHHLMPLLLLLPVPDSG